MTMMIMTMMTMIYDLQLKHVFTGKFVHISTTQTSRRDKNNMLVFIIIIIILILVFCYCYYHLALTTAGELLFC